MSINLPTYLISDLNSVLDVLRLTPPASDSNYRFRVNLSYSSWIAVFSNRITVSFEVPLFEICKMENGEGCRPNFASMLANLKKTMGS